MGNLGLGLRTALLPLLARLLLVLLLSARLLLVLLPVLPLVPLLRALLASASALFVFAFGPPRSVDGLDGWSRPPVRLRGRRP
ncbi:hypothetical protein ACZ91_14710 [Streptomyces regensis]|nr:hypothetical protein ACZ91_14710 [Streptomyces regensis]